MRVWCVDIKLSGGKHEVRVFDNYEHAERFKLSMTGGVYMGVAVIDTHLWEM